MTLKPSPGRKGDPVWLPEVLRAFGVKVIEDKGWRMWGQGDFGTIWGVMAHHTGANNTSAQYIRYNPGISNALSSQIHLSRDGVVTLVGAGIAWHAGRGDYPGLPKNDANRLTIGIEAQGDGQTWPDAQMDAYYRTCAAICWYLGLPASRVIAHHEWAWEAQKKWDPGLNGQRMPMGQFRAKVQHYIDHPPHLPTTSIPEGSSVSILTPTYFTDFIKGFIGPQFDVLAQVRDLLQDVQTQLRGPGLGGWAQLGQNSKGQNLTVPDALAALRHDIARLEKKIDEVRS